MILLSEGATLDETWYCRVGPLQQLFEFIRTIEQHYQKQDAAKDAARERGNLCVSIDVEAGHWLWENVKTCKGILEREPSQAHFSILALFQISHNLKILYMILDTQKINF